MFSVIHQVIPKLAQERELEFGIIISCTKTKLECDDAHTKRGSRSFPNLTRSRIMYSCTHPKLYPQIVCFYG